MFTNLHGAKADYSKTKNDQNIHFQMAPRLVLPTARNWSHQHPQRPHVCKYKCHWRWYWWCDYLTIKENPQNAKNVYHFHNLDHELHHHQASVNQMSGAGRLVQQALGSMLEILKQEVFNATTVRPNLIYIWPKVCTHLFFSINSPNLAILIIANILFEAFSILLFFSGEGCGLGIWPPPHQTWQRCLARRPETSLW